MRTLRQAASVLATALLTCAQIPAQLTPTSQSTAATEHPNPKRAQKAAERGAKAEAAGRIDEALQSGWAHVLGNDRKPIARCVGSSRSGGPQYGFAMELPEVFWLEDMAARHADAAAKVDALKTSPFRAPSGTVQGSDKGKFYSPDDAALTVQKGA